MTYVRFRIRPVIHTGSVGRAAAASVVGVPFTGNTEAAERRVAVVPGTQQKRRVCHTPGVPAQHLRGLPCRSFIKLQPAEIRAGLSSVFCQPVRQIRFRLRTEPTISPHVCESRIFDVVSHPDRLARGRGGPPDRLRPSARWPTNSQNEGSDLTEWATGILFTWCRQAEKTVGAGSRRM